MSQRKAWFCYERNFAMQNIPVIYYDDPPTKSMAAKELTPHREGLVEISHLPTTPDGEYSLSELQKLYPDPKLLQKGTFGAKDNSKETRMTRPVTGFITAQGQFFESAAEAELFEATYQLTKITTTLVKERFDDATEETINSVVDGIRTFIEENEKTIREFLDARAACLQESCPSTVDVDRSTTGDNQADDPSVRSGTDIQMESTENTKDISPRSGEKSKS